MPKPIGKGEKLIVVESNDEKDVQSAVAGIKNIARKAWFAALDSRGLRKIQLSEIEFEEWWKDVLRNAKTTID